MQWRSSDEAVSPAVGSALMIAVVVVLSGAMFTYLADEPQPQDRPSLVVFQKQEQTDRLEVLRSPVHVDWEDLLLRSTEEVPGLQAVQDESPKNVATGPVRLSGGPVEAGDFVSFCADQATGQVPLLIVHEPSGAVVFDGTFLSIAAC